MQGAQHMDSLMFISKVHCGDLSMTQWSKNTDYNIRGHVDLWRVSVAKMKQKLRSIVRLLSKDERLKFFNLKNEADRLQYAIGKGVLKILLAKYLHKKPKDIVFKEGINKKPMLKDNEHFSFNVSHSKDWVIFGFCEEELGVDIELIDTHFDFLSIINNWLSPSEAHYIENTYSPRHEFFKLWTRKEALLKATSVGMTSNLNAINCLDGMQYIPYEVGGGFSDWQIRSLFLDENYSLSITFPVSYMEVRFFEI